MLLTMLHHATDGTRLNAKRDYPREGGSGKDEVDDGDGDGDGDGDVVMVPRPGSRQPVWSPKVRLLLSNTSVTHL
jgi:hypothetical protein